MHMRIIGRHTPGLLTAVAAVVLTACSQASTAPTQDDDALMAFAKTAGGPQWPARRFTYEPKHAESFDIGQGSRLVMPADAVCDPERSTYGPTEWNTPCPLLKKPITLMVQVYVEPSGSTRVEFQPQIRFSPSQRVMLAIKDAAGAANPASVILYCPTGGGRCVDEGVADADLKTQHDPAGGYVSRRIKHFSGYNVAARSEGES